MTQIIDACNHTLVQFVSKPILQGNPVDSVTYDINQLPSQIVYNLKDGTQETVDITRDVGNNPIIGGITYVSHVINIPNATMEYAEPPTPPPAIVDIQLSNDSIDETAAVDTVVGLLTTSGGESPFGYALTSGDTYFKISGDELQVKASIDGISTPQAIEVQVTDTNGTQFSKPFDITIVDNPAITDITLSNTEVTDGDTAGTAIGTILPVGGTGPYSFSIDADPSNKFQLVGNELQLSDTADFDDTPYSVTLRVDDSKTRSYSKPFNITVNPAAYSSTLSSSFNGVDERMDILPDSSLESQSFTLSGWFDLQNNNGLDVYEKGSEYQLRIFTPTKIYFKINGQGAETKEGRVSNTGFPTDGFFHFTIGYDHNTDTSYIYINGQVPTITNVTNDPFPTGRGINTNSNLKLGVGGAGNYYNGLMDEVSFWDKALSQAEVQEIYNSGNPNNLQSHSAYSNLVSWWKMGEGATPPVMPDEKGNNDATMINMDGTNFVGDVP